MNRDALKPYLDDLERRIDPAVETALEDQWRAFIEGRNGHGPVFAPGRPAGVPAGIEWPAIPINDAIDRGIVILGLERHAAEAALAAGRELRGRVQCG